MTDYYYYYCHSFLFYDAVIFRSDELALKPKILNKAELFSHVENLQHFCSILRVRFDKQLIHTTSIFHTKITLQNVPAEYCV